MLKTRYKNAFADGTFSLQRIRSSDCVIHCPEPRCAHHPPPMLHALLPLEGAPQDALHYSATTFATSGTSGSWLTSCSMSTLAAAISTSARLASRNPRSKAVLVVPFRAHQRSRARQIVRAGITDLTDFPSDIQSAAPDLIASVAVLPVGALAAGAAAAGTHPTPRRSRWSISGHWALPSVVHRLRR